MVQSLTRGSLRSPGAETGGGGTILSAEEAVDKATAHVRECVVSAGIHGAADEALIGQAGQALRNRGLQLSLYQMAVETLVQIHSERIVGTPLSAVAAELKLSVGPEIERLANNVIAPSPQDVLELFVCMSNSIALNGVQGVFSNFAPIAKFHDLEGRAAAVLKICAPGFKMTPAVLNEVPGLLLKQGGREGFYPLRVFADQSDGIVHIYQNPQLRLLGSLGACQQRGLLLAILSYVAKAPEILSARHLLGGLTAPDEPWNSDATRQTAELYNALEAKWRPVYGSGIHDEILGK